MDSKKIAINEGARYMGHESTGMTLLEIAERYDRPIMSIAQRIALASLGLSIRTAFLNDAIDLETALSFGLLPTRYQSECYADLATCRPPRLNAKSVEEWAVNKGFQSYDLLREG